MSKGSWVVADGVVARDALLQRCLDFIQRTGFSRLSLREIAAGVGTSHRMIIYHFGSRDGLLTQVVQRIEADQRAELAALLAASSDLREVNRAFWQRVSDPALAPAVRLFFEVYAHALRDEPWTAQFRETVIATWLAPLSDLFVAAGFTPTDATRRARLGLATVRGLLLDLLVTHDTAAVDAAADLFADLLLDPPR
ncbi:MAG: TetR family transcriptional regulator [Jatrophihabitans sp.]